MASDDTAKKEVLPKMEKDIQHLISKLDSLSSMPLQSSNTCVKADAKALTVTLRQRMRILRRWRNGSGEFLFQDVISLSKEIITTRKRAVQLDFFYVSKQYSLIDEKNCEISQDIGLEKEDIKKQFEMVTTILTPIEKALKTLSNEDWIQLEQILKTLRGRIKNLKQKMTASLLDIEVMSLAPDGQKVGIESEEFNNHPLKNCVLELMNKTSLMIQGFKRNGHVIWNGDDGAACCVFNDVEVLLRQYSKLRRWRETPGDFDQDDITDVESIVTAIEGHLRKDYDDNRTRHCMPARSKSLGALSQPIKTVDGTSDRKNYKGNCKSKTYASAMGKLEELASDNIHDDNKNELEYSERLI